NGQMSLLARPLRVDERIVEYMLGSDRLDPRVAVHGRLYGAGVPGQEWVLPAEIQDGLLSILRDESSSGDRPTVGPVIYLHGAAASGKRAMACAACAAAGRPLL